MPWQWVYSPHIHMVSNFYVDCTSPITKAAWNQVQEEKGVKYANLSQDAHYNDLKNQVLVPRPGYIDSVETLESIVKYELGHSLVKRDGRTQAIVYVGAWCRLNFKAEWTSHSEVDCDDDDVPYRRVHSSGEVIGNRMKITVHYVDSGNTQPS